jgi:hypothetical protein
MLKFMFPCQLVCPMMLLSIQFYATHSQSVRVQPVQVHDPQGVPMHFYIHDLHFMRMNKLYKYQEII